MIKHFSYSSLRSYTTCTQQWAYRYRDKLRAVEVSTLPRRGKLVDDGLSAALKCVGVAPADLIATTIRVEVSMIVEDFIERGQVEEAEELVNLATESIRIAQRAYRWIQNMGWETVWFNGEPLVQVKIEIDPLDPTAQCQLPFVGYLDWIAKDPESGTNWIVDHKVRGTFIDDETMSYDAQLPGYLKALRQMPKYKDLEIKGVAQFQIKNKVPKSPRVLKNGKLSVAANQSCDWETFRSEIEDHQVAEYTHMKEKLPAFQKMSRRYISPEELNGIWNNVINMSKENLRFEICEIEPIKSFDVNKCRFCEFQPLCKAELRGHDATYIRKNQFVKA